VSGFPKFGSVKLCPKCKHEPPFHHRYFWCPTEDKELQEEYLRVECPDCGFSWYEQCADAEAE